MANIRENCSSRKSDFNRSAQRNQTKSGRKMWKIPNDQIIFLGFAIALCGSLACPMPTFAQYCIIFHMHLLIFMVILFYFWLVLDVAQAPSFHHRKRRWFAYIKFSSVVKLASEPKLPLIWLGGFDLIAYRSWCFALIVCGVAAALSERHVRTLSLRVKFKVCSQA